MQKNVAGQKWIVFAFQDEGGANPGEPVTGDAANITANLRLDGGAANAVDDTNPAELEAGFYAFDITQAESNADLIVIAPVSATANVNVIGVPAAVYTTPASFNAGALALASSLATSDGKIDQILADTGTDGVVLSTAQVNTIRDAITAAVVEAEGSITLQECLSIVLAYAAGQATGQATTAPVFKTPDGAANRIQAVTDGSGNRSSVTLTPSA